MTSLKMNNRVNEKYTLIIMTKIFSQFASLDLLAMLGHKLLLTITVITETNNY